MPMPDSPHERAAGPAAGARRRGQGAVRPILLAVVALAILAALPFVPWRELGRVLAAADPAWLAVAVAANLAIFPLWVWQWRLLALPGTVVRWPVMFEIVALSAAARSTLSALAGAASAVTLLNLRGRMPLVAATSLLALDQLLVGIAKLAVLALAFSLAPLPAPAVAGTAVFAALVAALFLALAALAWMPARTTALAGGAHPLAGRLLALLERVSAGLGAMRSPLRAGLTVLLALAKKLTEVAAALAVQLACGIEPSLTAAILSVAAVSLTTAVPVIPGNIGTYAATVFLVYEALGIPTAQGLAAGLLQHAVVLVPSILLGYGTMAATRLARTTAGGPA